MPRRIEARQRLAPHVPSVGTSRSSPTSIAASSTTRGEVHLVANGHEPMVGSDDNRHLLRQARVVDRFARMADAVIGGRVARRGPGSGSARLRAAPCRRPAGEARATPACAFSADGPPHGSAPDRRRPARRDRRRKRSSCRSARQPHAVPPAAPARPRPDRPFPRSSNTSAMLSSIARSSLVSGQNSAAVRRPLACTRVEQRRHTAPIDARGRLVM